ncbi:MAG: hypothetical protein M0033_05270 [Nitrospiraceae bacterium]|nr:hypothetical protein [Nitrospiraceae bacterium]
MNRVKTLFLISMLTFSFIPLSNSFADQCAYISQEQASKAMQYLQGGTTIYEFCQPCGDTSPSQLVVHDSQVKSTGTRMFNSSNEYVEIAVNNQNIDLAYTYVPDGKGKYINLAFLSGCPTTGVSKYLPQASAPELNQSESNQNESTQSNSIDKIQISVKANQELFPVIAKFLAERKLKLSQPGIITWTIRNQSNRSVNVTVSSEIPQWTEPVIDTVQIGPYETKIVGQNPFGNNLLNNISLMPATIILKAQADGKVLYDETQNINIRPVDDMVWGLNKPWDTTPLIAAWVTPKDPLIEQILSIAKGGIWNRIIFDGYMENNPSHVIEQVRAIFNAVRNLDVSYVNSTINFGQVSYNTQRVRIPKESISERSANCIDGTVLFASLFENIGLEPLIVLVNDPPIGHAFIGVRLSPGSNQNVLFIETTDVGRPIEESISTLETTYNAAVKDATDEYSKYYNDAHTKPSASVQIIDIKQARQMGIYPLW